MKVKDLISRLQRYNPELDVVVAKDSQESDASPLDRVDRGHYEPEEPWWGFYTDEANLEGNNTEISLNAICLWPES